MSEKYILDLEKVSFDGGFKMENYWVWCGSLIKDDKGIYHLFASRWPKTLKMHPGWMFKSEIVRATSSSPLGPFKFKEVVLKERGAEYWDGRATHNPFITKYKDKYLLFYSGTTYPFSCPDNSNLSDHSNPVVLVAGSGQRIGLAIADDLEGPWKRFDKPILDVRPGKFDSCIVTNPSVLVEEDGSILLIYKGRAFDGNLPGWKMEFGVAKAKSYLGPYERINADKLFDSEFDLEDPYIWKENNRYHMISKDMNGNACGEVFGGAYGYSSDGLKWNIIKGAKSYSRTFKMENGDERVMSNVERPFIFNDNGKKYFICAVGEGPGKLEDLEKAWNLGIAIKNIKLI